MFTPPPSPNPTSAPGRFPLTLPTIADHTPDGLDPSPPPASSHPHPHPHHPGTPIEEEDPEQKKKKSIGRQTKWTVLLVPVVLVAVTASTRYLAHPAVFDLFVGGPEGVSWKSAAAGLGRVHQRHHSQGGRADRAKRDEAWAGGEPASTTSSGGGSNAGSGGIATGTPAATGTAATGTTATGTVATGTTATGTVATGTQATGTRTGTGTGTVAQSSTASTAATTTTAVNIQPLPTVPSTPPVLPTPFPQPLSAGIPTDNMSVSCVAFFNNMTNSLPFRQCRAFSLLLQSSDDVIQAETNMTQLNTIVWGTCNAAPGKDQCVKNMGWFADQLQSACPRELKDGLQPIAADTLIALDAYSLMYDAACTLMDPTTNSYCFINAAHNSNPSDLYLYQLPIGNTYPSSASPTCSTCSKSLLSLYWDALHNSSISNDLTTLASMYNSGAKAVDTMCRSNFATLLNYGARRFAPSSLVVNLFLVLGFWLAWTCL